MFVGNGIPDADRPSFLISSTNGLSLLANVFSSVRTAPDTVTYSLDVPSAFAGSNVTLSIGAFTAAKVDRGLYPLLVRQFSFLPVLLNMTSPSATTLVYWYLNQTYTTTVTSNDPFSSAEIIDVYLVNNATGQATLVGNAASKSLSIPVRVPSSLAPGYIYRLRLVWRHRTLTLLPTTFTKEGGNIQVMELVRFSTSDPANPAASPVTWQPGLTYYVNFSTGVGVAATTLVNFYLWDDVAQNGIQISAPIAMGAVGGAVAVVPRFALAGRSWKLAAKIAMPTPSFYFGQPVNIGTSSVSLANNAQSYRSGQIVPLAWSFAPRLMLAADKHDLWLVRSSNTSGPAVTLGTARAGNLIPAINWTSPVTFVTAQASFSISIALTTSDLVQYFASPRLLPSPLIRPASGSFSVLRKLLTSFPLHSLCFLTTSSSGGLF